MFFVFEKRYVYQQHRQAHPPCAIALTLSFIGRIRVHIRRVRPSRASRTFCPPIIRLSFQIIISNHKQSNPSLIVCSLYLSFSPSTYISPRSFASLGRAACITKKICALLTYRSTVFNFFCLSCAYMDSYVYIYPVVVFCFDVHTCICVVKYINIACTIFWHESRFERDKQGCNWLVVYLPLRPFRFKSNIATALKATMRSTEVREVLGSLQSLRPEVGHDAGVVKIGYITYQYQWRIEPKLLYRSSGSLASRGNE